MKSVRPAAKDSREIATQVRAYLASQPVAVRKELRKLQAAIRSAAPGAVEWFSYGVPGFRLDGKPLAWYGGWKAHTSLYPITPGMRKANADELDDYETSKGTVRFPLAKPLPVHLVYDTAWVDKAGTVQFRPDVYGRDQKEAAVAERGGKS